MQKVTVLLIDHFKMITNALANVLIEDGRFEVVGETDSKDQGLSIATAKYPLIVLLNVDMSFLVEFGFIRKIKKYSPISKIIGVTSCRIPAYAKQILREGASGYITLNSTVEEFVKGIVEVYEGKTFICRDIVDIIADNLLCQEKEETNLSLLTQRELAVIDFIRRGFSSKEIAAEMHISLKTIEVHRYNILKKLKLKNTAALVNYVNMQGL